MSTPNNTPPTEGPLIIDSSFEAELFWEKNRKLIIGATVVVALVLIGGGLWFYNSYRAKGESEALFADAKNPESWRAVIAKYPGSLAAANASFLLAESLREQGNIDESNKTYELIISGYPNHPLLGGARLGLAENLAVQGKVDQSIESLRQIQGDQSSGYAASVAGLLEGQALIRQGKIAEARKVFQNTAQADALAPAGRIASALAQQLSTLLPPEKAAPAAPVATPAP